jgi:hypothetical protein
MKKLSGNLLSFTTGGDQPIPPSSVVQPPSNAYTYTMKIDTTAAGYLQFYFVDIGGVKWPLSIWKDLVVTVNLDPNWNWEFIQNAQVPPMTLGPQDPAENNPYWGLQVLAPNAQSGLYQQIRFNALRSSEPLYHADPFNLYVLLHQPDGTSIPIKIDPDIQNPGDPPPNQLGG